MPLTVLTDKDVRGLLDTLGREDILDMHKVLARALHIYSTSTDSEESGCAASKQPSRISIKRKDGSVALIMPASSDEALGVKLVTVSESGKEGSKTSLPFRLDTASGSKSGSISSESRSATTISSASSTASPTSSRTSITRESSNSTGSSQPVSSKEQPPVLTEVPKDLESLEPEDTSPKGSVTLLDNSGRPRALINASTMTAFRTALASMMIFKGRKSVHTLTVFGAGMQAYWHIHLALLLRTTEIHRIHVINRGFDRAQKMMIKLASSENEELSDAFLGRKLQPSILTPEYGEYDRLLKEYVRGSDAIFCCTPSTTPLFPAGHLTHLEGRRKARYIAAIGSYKPHMCEIHPEILQQAVAGPHSSSSHHGLHIRQSHANEGGAVIVDSIEGAMKEAGEIIQAKISGQGVVELGELVMLKRSHWAEKAEQERIERERREKDADERSISSTGSGSGTGSGHHHHFGGHGLAHLFKHSHKSDDEDPRDTYREKGVTKSHPNDGGLGDWLQRGNVIYKSVGIGLMDVVVGMELVRLAEERGFGTFVPDF